MTELVGDLEPVIPLRFSRGLALAMGAMAVAVVSIFWQGDIRADVMAGQPREIFLVSTGLFLLLGLACTVAVVLMGSPRVGAARNGWQWALAMASVLPVTALIIGLSRGASAWAASEADHGVVCLEASVGLGLLTGAVLTLWLRRGAPSMPERAGLLTGIAAGCAGVFAFSFACPIDSFMHTGIWHGLAVVASALLGRLVVPPLVRW
ncbi:MAG: DUF1109 domain-containing protein [Sphingomonadaceae bacterium]